MKAVVLVGGEGTRLRPLTETTPKPLLPLVDRAILDHVLDHLVAHGVEQVVMSSPYLEDTFEPFIAGRRGSPDVLWVTEREPLGTGGAVVSVLDRLGDDSFLALNGDILTDLDLTQMVARHRERRAAVTIALHHVTDARAFGLVTSDPDGRISGFREKPPDAVPGEINAGTYVMDPEALRGWPAGRMLSIEREIFPSSIERGLTVVGFPSRSYWLDLGTPEQYLRAHVDLLEGKVEGVSYEAPWLAPGVRVDPTAHLGRSVVAGEGATVGAEARLAEAVLLSRAEIGTGAYVLRSIVGPEAVVGAGASIVDSVLGEGARVADGTVLEGARVAPGALAEPS